LLRLHQTVPATDASTAQAGVRPNPELATLMEDALTLLVLPILYRLTYGRDESIEAQDAGAVSPAS
jgi:hypothetical protein